MAVGWGFLLVSILFEMGWVSSLKFTEGFTKLWPSILNILLAAGGITTLAQAVRTIPVSIAYSVWTGVSLVGVLAINVYFFGETIGPWHFVFIALIISGAVGLKAL